MRAVIVLVVLVASAPVRAEPRFSAGGAMHARTALSFGPYAGGSAWVAACWRERFHVAMRASVGSGGVLVLQELVEAGMWLHASRHLDVLVGWRAGHAYLEIPVNDGMPITVNAL